MLILVLFFLSAYVYSSFSQPVPGNDGVKAVTAWVTESVPSKDNNDDRSVFFSLSSFRFSLYSCGYACMRMDYSSAVVEVRGFFDRLRFRVELKFPAILTLTVG